MVVFSSQFCILKSINHIPVTHLAHVMYTHTPLFKYHSTTWWYTGHLFILTNTIWAHPLSPTNRLMCIIRAHPLSAMNKYSLYFTATNHVLCHNFTISQHVNKQSMHTLIIKHIWTINSINNYLYMITLPVIKVHTHNLIS